MSPFLCVFKMNFLVIIKITIMMKNLFQNSKKYKISATFFWLCHWKNHWNPIIIDKVIDFNIRLFYAYNLISSYSGLKSQTLHNDLNELLCRPFVISSFKKGKLIVLKTYFRHLQSSEARGKWLCLLKIDLSCNFEKKIYFKISLFQEEGMFGVLRKHRSEAC